MDGFEELPADAQIDPIPQGYEELPADVAIEPTQAAPMDQKVYRQKLAAAIKTGRRDVVDSFLRSQGVDPAQAQGIDEAIAAAKQGRDFGVHVTDGATTANAAPETAGQALYRGVGDVAAGVGDLLGIVANPLNAGINYVAGTNLSTDLGQTFRDWTGAPEAVTDQERILSMAGRGGAAGIAGAGAGAAVGAAAGGLTGYVGRQVAAAPVVDLVSGVTGGAGSEIGQQYGGTAGAVAGGLAGGLAGATAIQKIINRLPAELALTSRGTLTPEAHELALRAGVDEDDLAQSYARARTVQNSPGRRSPQERQAAREAFRNRPTGEDVVLPESAPTSPSVAQDVPDLAGQNQRLVDAISERIPAGQAEDVAPTAPTTARERYDEAQSEGVRLSRGQAEQDFDVQNDENALRVSATKEGEQARGFFRDQQEQIQGAITRFRSAFGTDAGNAADRGAQVKEAVKALRDNGREGVNQLYRQAEELGGEGLKLETAGIRDAATDVLIDEAVPEAVKKSVAQELARYGIIGDAGPINEAGITRVTLDDGSAVSFRGPVKELTASSADAMRKAINRLYLSDPTRASQAIKPAIDDALEAAIENAATREGGIGDAYRVARDAHRTQRQTFNAKDIVENLIAVKKGTQTDVMLPERGIAEVIGKGKEGVTNLRRVKSLLLSSNHPTSQTAWRAIQHQGLADIFDKAISRNINHGGGQIGDVVSGAKLNSAIETFGVDKLRELLDAEEFNGLMKLRRIIGTATIPISGTTNPSGTATKIINYLRQGTLRFAGAIPGVGGAVNAFAGLAAKGKEIAATRRTLEGITSYDGRAETSRRLDEQARDFVREYIDSGTSGRLVPTGINLTRTTPQNRNDQ
jgi:hypothetical protein